MDVVARSQQRRRLLRFATIGILLSFCVIGVSYYSVHPFNGVDADELANDLREELKTGSSIDEGKSWFASRRINHSEYMIGSWALPRCSFDPPVHSGSDLNVLHAEIPNRTLFDTATIDVYLLYDSNRRLVSTAVARDTPPRSLLE